MADAKVFPNPGRVTDIQFELSGMTQASVAVAFYDAQGRLLYQNTSMSLDEAGRFSLPKSLTLPEGHYYVRVLNGQKPFTSTFLVRP